MPLIRVETNQAVGSEEGRALLADLSRLGASVLGKPEGYVMVGLRAGEVMQFAGSDAPLAYVEVKSIGLQPAQATAMSKATCAFLQDRLGVDPARIYIEFASPSGEMWGWNGETF